MPRTTSAVKEAFIYLAILKLIPAKSAISSIAIKDNLRTKFGIDISYLTLSRYLSNLRERDEFGVVCDTSSKPFSYRLNPNAEWLPQSQLSAQECLLYRLVEENLSHQIPGAFLKNLQPLFSKARETLKDSGARTKEQAWLNKVAVVPNQLRLIPPTIKPRVFNEVSQALFEEKWLEVSYHNRNGEKKEKKLVNPLAIVQQGECIYLVVQFETYSNFRHLAIHRIDDARKTERLAQRPADFRLKDYLRCQEFNYTGPIVSKVRLAFETRNSVLALRLGETKLAPNQTIRKADDVWIVTAPQIIDSVLLDRWLLAEQAENVRKTPIVQSAAPSA